MSPTKKGVRWEQIRLEKVRKDKIAEINLADLDACHLAAWRDTRLKEVSEANVRREMVILSGVLTQGRKEWKLIGQNPMADVRKPAGSRAGEIVGPTLENVELEDRVCHLPRTRNGTKRDVPLSQKAVNLLESLPQMDPVWG